MTECHTLTTSSNILFAVQVWCIIAMFISISLTARCVFRPCIHFTISIMAFAVSIAAIVIIYATSIIKYCNGESNTVLYICIGTGFFLPYLIHLLHFCVSYPPHYVEQIPVEGYADDQVIIEVNKLGE